MGGHGEIDSRVTQCRKDFYWRRSQWSCWKIYCEGFERVHGGQGYGVMNESRDSILDFAITYDLISTNTWFKKGSHT